MKTSRVFGYSLAVILFVLQRPVSGLQCYSCNSHNDSRCAGLKLPEAMKKDCATLEQGNKHTMCRKITQVIEFEVNGLPPDSRVIRGCGWDESNYKGRCYQRSGFGGRQEVCSCTDDYCNSAPKSLPTLTVLAVSGLSLLSAFFLFN
ncbi:uncharacterized protein LOC143914508 [Arctopsyche grandis]|uniref:uncharacterized protein LOC143914508 n=1 Tax=Arctopsyche grandis TaxID=121162 RepID=UPI00406D8D78